MSADESADQSRAGRPSARDIGPLPEVGRVFLQERKASHRTEFGLARRLDVSESQVRRWERDGYSSATLDQLQRVADVLGVRFSVTAYFEGM